MLGVAAQRIVQAIRKPCNNADEAIAAKAGWDGAFRAICCVAPLANGDPPLASRRFVHLIPESLRRDHAGLMQRFPNRTFGARRSSRPCPWRYAAARRRCAHAWEP